MATQLPYLNQKHENTHKAPTAQKKIKHQDIKQKEPPQKYRLGTISNTKLKTLLELGLSEPEFYGDLIYKFKKLIGRNDYSFQYRKIIITRYRRIGYNLNVMRQSACLVFNPIMVDNYAAFFNCTPVDRASDSMMAPT